MSAENGKPDLKVFSTGATRTKDADGERYDLISPIGLERVARIYAEGATKYGDSSWEKGLPISDLMNHGLRHWRLYASGDRSEDHLAKVAWAAMAACHSEVMWPQLNTNLRRSVGGQHCIPSTVDDATAASWRKFDDAMEGLRRDYREAEGKVEHETFGTVQVPDRKVPTKFYLLADRSDRLRMARYRTDLHWEGHEVVSRWIDYPGISVGEDDFDIQSCDVAIIFPTSSTTLQRDIEYVRGFSKPSVLVGSICPPGFPEHGKSERWFPTWDAFLKSLSPSRVANGVASFL